MKRLLIFLLAAPLMALPPAKVRATTKPVPNGTKDGMTTFGCPAGYQMWHAEYEMVFNQKTSAMEQVVRWHIVSDEIPVYGADLRGHHFRCVDKTVDKSKATTKGVDD